MERAALAPVSVYSSVNPGAQVELGTKGSSSKHSRRLSVNDAVKGAAAPAGGLVASPSKKRRSQSMGGALLEAAAVRAAAASAMELSPRSECIALHCSTAC